MLASVISAINISAMLFRRVGAAAIPSMMISLGGALSKGPGDSKVSTKAVLSLVAIRLIILPAIGSWAVLSGANIRFCNIMTLIFGQAKTKHQTAEKLN